MYCIVVSGIVARCRIIIDSIYSVSAPMYCVGLPCLAGVDCLVCSACNVWCTHPASSSK